MDEKYVVTPLNTADFLELSKTYTRNSGDVQEFIEITLNAIKATGKKQIKWLTVGPLHGFREHKILARLRSEVPDCEVTLMEAFEPNPEGCQLLTTSIEKGTFWLSDRSSMRVHNSFFSSDTVLSETFDVVTASHVFYFIQPRAERVRVMRKLLSALSVGGVIVINQGPLHTDCLDQTAKLLKAFTHRLIYIHDNVSHVESFCSDLDRFLGARELREELDPVATECCAVKMYPYKNFLFMGQPGSSSPRETLQMLSGLMNYDVAKGDPKLQEELFAWLLDNGQVAEDGVRLILEAGVIVYTKEKQLQLQEKQ